MLKKLFNAKCEILEILQQLITCLKKDAKATWKNSFLNALNETGESTLIAISYTLLEIIAVSTRLFKSPHRANILNLGAFPGEGVGGSKSPF